MTDIIQMITNKWGALYEFSSFKANGFPDYLDGTAFNYLYDPVDIKTIEKILRKNKLSFPEDLLNLYRKFNGVRLFLSGFSIYGFPLRRQKYNPYDFCLENIRIHIEMSNHNCDVPEWFFWGSYAGQYVFAYDNTKTQKYICVEKGYNTILRSFCSADELVSYFVSAIAVKYDDNCNKLIPNDEYSDIPVLANAMLTLDELD